MAFHVNSINQFAILLVGHAPMYKELSKNNHWGPVSTKKLIPIPRELEPIICWRPVTLLNASYKILIKALAMRVKHIMPKIFIQDRLASTKGDLFWKNPLQSRNTWSGPDVGAMILLLLILTLRKHLTRSNGLSF